MNQSARSFTHGVRRTVLAALALTALGTTAAWATVTTWTYNSSASFNTGATTWTSNNPPTTGNCAITNTATKLAWGCPSNVKQSSLVLDPTGGTGLTVDTDGPIADPGFTLTHNNFVISGNSLTGAELDVVIDLTNPASPPGNPYSLNLGISFTETSNSGTCAVAPINPKNPCPDIFVIDSQSLTTSFNYDDGTGLSKYFLTILPQAGIAPLSNAACKAAHSNSGCLGFVTQENQANEMLFGLTITSKPIIETPEPGILGMMGLGLLGIGLGGYALRRRKLSVHH